MVKWRLAERISLVLTRNDGHCSKSGGRRKDPEAGPPGWGPAVASERVP